MIERLGNLFDTDAPALGHGVNTDGLMGAGIAKQFKNRYFHNYVHYRQACSDKMIHTGYYVACADKGKIIYNIASQDRPGPHAKRDWLTNGLLHTSIHAASIGINRIAIPEIGCGIGGLERDDLDYAIDVAETNVTGVEYEVWTFDPNI